MQYLCNDCGMISEVEMEYRGKEPKPLTGLGYWTSLCWHFDQWNHTVTCPICNWTKHIMIHTKEE